MVTVASPILLLLLNITDLDCFAESANNRSLLLFVRFVCIYFQPGSNPSGSISRPPHAYALLGDSEIRNGTAAKAINQNPNLLAEGELGELGDLLKMLSNEQRRHLQINA